MVVDGTKVIIKINNLNMLEEQKKKVINETTFLYITFIDITKKN